MILAVPHVSPINLNWIVNARDVETVGSIHIGLWASGREKRGHLALRLAGILLGTVQ